MNPIEQILNSSSKITEGLIEVEFQFCVHVLFSFLLLVQSDVSYLFRAMLVALNHAVQYYGSITSDEFILCAY